MQSVTRMIEPVEQAGDSFDSPLPRSELETGCPLGGGGEGHYHSALSCFFVAAGVIFQMLRDWAWELTEKGHGPDHFFIARFNPSDAGRLAAWVRRQPLPGFAFDPELSSGKGSHCASRVVFVDEATAEKLAANRAGEPPGNIWIYNQIEVCDHQLTIERGYASALVDDSNFIEAIIQSPDVIMVEWTIFGGGQGYGAQQVASGTTAAELMAYLQA